MTELYVRTRSAWRAWLERNHAKAREVWFVYPKAHTGKPCVRYDDSVEEALAFGWVDSLIRTLDEERYARKFTPRRVGSRWSSDNVARVKKMIREGKMTEKGLALYREGMKGGRVYETGSANAKTRSAALSRALKGNSAARKFYEALPPGCRRQYVNWIEDAKKAETKERRVSEALRMLVRGKRIGMK